MHSRPYGLVYSTQASVRGWEHAGGHQLDALWDSVGL